jgi:hypothetical protein
MLVAGAAFFVLDRVIARQGVSEEEWLLLRRAAQRKNLISIGIYAVAIPIAFYRTSISLGLTFLVALLYAVPSLWVERYADALEGRDADRGHHSELHEPYVGPPADR